jgi:hypothetical protein
MKFSEELYTTDTKEERRLKLKVRHLEDIRQRLLNYSDKLTDENIAFKKEISANFCDIEEYFSDPSVNVRKTTGGNFGIKIEYDAHAFPHGIRFNNFCKEWVKASIIPKLQDLIISIIEKELR